MAKRPKTEGHRRGGRNRQFFSGLSGLARGIDAAIEKNKQHATVDAEALELQAREKVDEAEAKRKRKAYARLRAAGLVKGAKT